MKSCPRKHRIPNSQPNNSHKLSNSNFDTNDINPTTTLTSRRTYTSIFFYSSLLPQLPRLSDLSFSSSRDLENERHSRIEPKSLELVTSFQREHGYCARCGIDGRSSCTDSPYISYLSWRLIAISSMKIKVSHRSNICYRLVQPSDIEILEQIHSDVFPIRYEAEFFQNVVSGRDIVSWVAVDRGRPSGKKDEPIGFITARIILAKESEIGDLLRYDSSRSEQTLVYILTLGVVEGYRKAGIASSLIHEVIKYGSSIPTCRAVYLHVISYNNPAIHLYNKMSFKCVRRLQCFYFINGQHYDAYLFVYYVNGGRSPCSPLELLVTLMSYVRSGFKTMMARLRKSDEKLLRWPKSRESRCLMPTTQSKKNLKIEDVGCECV